MDALPCCFGTIYSQAPMAAVRLAMGAFLLFASGLAGAKAHAPLNGGVCVRRQRKACRLPLAGTVCLPRAGILPHKAAAPSAAAKGNRQPLCRKPLFGRDGFRPCHGRNAPAPFMCAHWLPKRVLRCGNALLWQECPSARPRPKQPALAMHGPGAQASGRNNSAQAPPCGRFESTSLPPCSRAASSAMARPRPICPAAGLRAASPE